MPGMLATLMWPACLSTTIARAIATGAETISPDPTAAISIGNFTAVPLRDPRQMIGGRAERPCC